MPTDVIAIKLILSLSSWGKQVSHHKKSRKETNTKKQTKQNRTSYPLTYAFMEDTIKHNIAQMTSTGKAYIPCLLVIIIKWCHMRQASKLLWWLLRITWKTVTLGLNQERTKQIYTYQKQLTNQSWKVQADVAVQIHWLEFSLCPKSYGEKKNGIEL